MTAHRLRTAAAKLREVAEGATPIAEAPDYAVTPLGEVWSVGSDWRGYGPRRLATTETRDGYLRVRLTVGGRRVNRSVHRLVASAFLGASDLQVCHLDGNRKNNHVQNLRWGTAADNAADRDSHGTTAIGRRNGWTRLSHDQVQEIRRLLAAGVRQRDIGARVGCSQYAVSDIKRGITWAWLPNPHALAVADAVLAGVAV